jgi:hypothetical protein
VLCAIRDLIERLLTPTAIVVITVLLLVASWIYPPWVSYGRYPEHNWYFIFSTRTGSMRIDLARLLLIDLIVAVPGALLAWTISRNTGARRIAAWIVFYAIVYLVLALLTVGIVWGGAVLIQNVQHEIAKRAVTQTKRFDPSTAALVKKSKASPYDALLADVPNKGPVTVEIPGHGIAEFPAGMSDDEISTVIKKKFFFGESPKGFDPLTAVEMVAPNDLKKITLFDVVAYVTADSRGYSFHGKVRDDLPRSVQKLEAKASFYDADEKLIESRTFRIRGVSVDQRDRNFGLATDTLSPGFAVSFDEWVQVSFLPKSATYRVEVIEAHYVK